MQYYIGPHRVGTNKFSDNVDLTAYDESGKRLLIFSTDIKNKKIIKGQDYVEDRDKDQEKLIFKAWGYSYGVTRREYAEAYVKNVLNPYLDSHGLQDAVVYVHEKNSDVVIEYQGCKMLLKDGSLDVSRYHCYCYPYADEKDSIFNSSFFASPKSYYAFNISFKILTLSAIARYVKIMPKYKDIIYGMKEKVQKVYNEIKG